MGDRLVCTIPESVFLYECVTNSAIYSLSPPTSLISYWLPAPDSGLFALPKLIAWRRHLYHLLAHFYPLFRLSHQPRTLPAHPTTNPTSLPLCPLSKPHFFKPPYTIILIPLKELVLTKKKLATYGTRALAS